MLLKGRKFSANLAYAHHRARLSRSRSTVHNAKLDKGDYPKIWPDYRIPNMVLISQVWIINRCAPSDRITLCRYR